MDKSFANGNGNSMANGPSALRWDRQGWDVRPETSWKLTIGQDPA